MPLTAIERRFEPDGSEHYRTDIIRDPSKDDLKNGGVFHLMADDGTLHREFIIRQPAPINNQPPA